MTAATWGCCLATRRLGGAADPRRRVPRARRPRRRRTVRRATRRRAPELVRLDEVRPAVYRTWRVADERRERSLHGAMLLIVERNGVMEAESS